MSAEFDLAAAPDPGLGDRGSLRRGGPGGDRGRAPGPTGARSSSRPMSIRATASGCSASRPRSWPAGSLDPEVVAELRAHRSLADRYLAVEGHRALAANDAVLPPWMRSMGDPVWPLGSTRRRRRWSCARHDRALAPRGPSDRSTPAGSSRQRRRAGRRRWPRGSPSVAGDPAEPRGARGRSETDRPGWATCCRAPSVEAARSAACWRSCCARPGAATAAGIRAPTRRPTCPGTGRGAGRTVVSPATRGATARGRRAASSATVHTYPEWDEHRQAYRPDWCHGASRTWPMPTRVRRCDLPDSAALRRALARLGTDLVAVPPAAPGRRPRHRRPGGGPGRSRGRRGPTTRTSTSTACDDAATSRCSSSSTSRDRPASRASPAARVHEHQREAAAALVAALHHLGDRVALLRLPARGAAPPCRSLRVKRFDDRLDDAGRSPPRRPCARGLHPARAPPSATARRCSTPTAAPPGASWSCCPTGSPTTTATRARYGEADARRALARGPPARASAACASASGPTPTRRRCGVCSGPPPTPPCPPPSSLPAVDRPAVPRGAALGRGAAAEPPAHGSARASACGRRRPTMTDGDPPVLRAGRQRGGGVRGRPPPGPGPPAQGPDGVRQDPLRRGDGPRPRATADHRLLPRRPDRRRPGRALPPRGRRHRVGRRPAHPGRAGGGHLLPRRDRRGPPGHHGGASTRWPTTAASSRSTGSASSLDAAPGFCLVVSYNPGYQSVLKDLKDSTRQRMVAIELDFPPADVEEKVVGPRGRASATTRRRGSSSSARRSVASSTPGCARWPRPGC